jgi:hypothetical protein
MIGTPACVREGNCTRCDLGVSVFQNDPKSVTAVAQMAVMPGEMSRIGPTSAPGIVWRTGDRL